MENNNVVFISKKKVTAEGFQRKLYHRSGKRIILKPTPFSFKIEKKCDSKKGKI